MTLSPDLSEDLAASPVLSRCRFAEQVLGYREHLLLIARPRVACLSDAEDAVQEALTRALERLDDLDPSRVEGWLTTVTINLCHDMGRDRHRHPKRVLYQVRQLVPEPGLEESVVEREYAAGVARRLADLPPAQRAALELRAAEMAVDEIAQRLSLSTKGAESLLSRARGAMKRLASGLAAVVVESNVRRRHPRWSPQSTSAVAAASAASALVLFTGGGAAPSGSPVAAPSHPVYVVASGSRPAVEVAAPGRSIRGRDETVVPAPLGPTAPGRLPPEHLHAGPVALDGGGLRRENPHQTLAGSVEACLSGGVTISATYLGCSAAH